jgi:hypothetical protein
MPNSVMFGQLRAKDETSITLGGDVRLILATGLDASGLVLGQSLTVWVRRRDGVPYAEHVRSILAASDY